MMPRTPTRGTDSRNSGGSPTPARVAARPSLGRGREGEDAGEDACRALGPLVSLGSARGRFDVQHSSVAAGDGERRDADCQNLRMDQHRRARLSWNQSFPVLQGILPLGPEAHPAGCGRRGDTRRPRNSRGHGLRQDRRDASGDRVYTILVPIAVFAVLDPRAIFVVGADSATAATMAAGLSTLAPIASPKYVALAGMLAIVTGGILIVARVVRLGSWSIFCLAASSSVS